MKTRVASIWCVMFNGRCCLHSSIMFSLEVREITSCCLFRSLDAASYLTFIGMRGILQLVLKRAIILQLLALSSLVLLLLLNAAATQLATLPLWPTPNPAEKQCWFWDICIQSIKSATKHWPISRLVAFESQPAWLARVQTNQSGSFYQIWHKEGDPHLPLGQLVQGHVLQRPFILASSFLACAIINIDTYQSSSPA